MLLASGRSCSFMVCIGLLCLSASLGCGRTRTRAERIHGPSAEFLITVGGTADHRRMGGWREDPKAEHNPTRRLTITNLGDRPVINPRVTVEGGPDWFNIDHIVNEFSRPGMTDEEKSFALWQWCRHHIEGGPTFEGPIWGQTRSMTRFMNAFGTGACGTYHVVMPVIGKQAGLRTYTGCFADCSHAVQREFYDGQDRYFDAHIAHQRGQPRGWFARKLNNTEIAGIDDIMADRYLIDRAGGGPGRFGYVAYFGPGCSFHEEKSDRRDPHEMAITLRPGERICWLWDLNCPEWKAGNETAAASMHGSGYVEFAPRLRELDALRDSAVATNVRFVSKAGRAAATPSDVNSRANLAYRVCCPYPVTKTTVAGEFDLGDGGQAALSYSFDGKQYQPVWESAGNGQLSAQVDVPDAPRFHEPRFTHELWFRVTLGGRGKALPAVRKLVFREYFQVFRPSLPSLHAGRNVVRYRGKPDVGPAWTRQIARAGRAGLANGGFETQAEPGKPPTGWTSFGRTDGAHVGPWFAKTWPLEGKAMFGAAADWDIKTGGVYQRVHWRGGRRVRAAVCITTRGDNTETAGCRVGLDPTGGTDPGASTVVWSAYARSPEWKRIETGFVDMPTDREDITVFLMHRHAADGGRFNVTGFDACVLEDPDTPPAPGPERSDPSDLVVVEYEWQDVPNLPVPAAPAKPTHPRDGGRFGFNGMFRWSPAAIDGRTTIDNYEIYISPRPDLAWPVMPNTHRYTGSGEPEFVLVAPDVLRPGATYYWRVRGRSADGVWGDWSDTWSFIADGPGAPLHLKAAYDPETGSAVLSWSPPQVGTEIDHYEVYGSGEHGFSPLRAPEIGDILGTKVQRPATLIADTKRTTWDVSSHPEVYYRLTAVDQDGNRSVPTPILELPHPALLPMELPPAVVGEPYTATLVARLRTGRYAVSLREGVIIDGADEPTFSLQGESSRGWLTIEATTGALSGVPSEQDVGVQDFAVTLADGRDGKCTRRYQLQVVAP